MTPSSIANGTRRCYIGQAQIDAVDLASAERIEVIRGHSSVLYGNAAGGVLDITTGVGSEMRRSLVVRAQGGSHDFRKLALRNGGETGNWVHLLRRAGARLLGSY